MSEWLEDERPAIKAFAERHIAELKVVIASEQRRVESRKEIRKRDYEDDDTESGDNIGNEGER